MALRREASAISSGTPRAETMISCVSSSGSRIRSDAIGSSTSAAAPTTIASSVTWRSARCVIDRWISDRRWSSSWRSSSASTVVIVRSTIASTRPIARTRASSSPENGLSTSRPTTSAPSVGASTQRDGDAARPVDARQLDGVVGGQAGEQDQLAGGGAGGEAGRGGEAPLEHDGAEVGVQRLRGPADSLLGGRAGRVEVGQRRDELGELLACPHPSGSRRSLCAA